MEMISGSASIDDRAVSEPGDIGAAEGPLDHGL
jgi:hypothetical protein